MTLARQLLILAHLVVGAVVILLLMRTLGERSAVVTEIRQQAAREHDDRARLQSDIDQKRQIRDGLRANDAYVVELLARERLGYSRAGEHLAPNARAAAPAGIDKAGATGRE